jgi:hypothetical protein
MTMAQKSLRRLMPCVASTCSFVLEDVISSGVIELKTSAMIPMLARVRQHGSFNMTLQLLLPLRMNRPLNGHV